MVNIQCVYTLIKSQECGLLAQIMDNIHRAVNHAHFPCDVSCFRKQWSTLLASFTKTHMIMYFYVDLWSIRQCVHTRNDRRWRLLTRKTNNIELDPPTCACCVHLGRHITSWVLCVVRRAIRLKPNSLIPPPPTPDKMTAISQTTFSNAFHE